MATAFQTTADYIRAMGLEIGDTIEGREDWPTGWTVTRLTLLWVGKEVAVWRSASRGSSWDGWTQPQETADWYLGCRDWQIVPPGSDAATAEQIAATA